MQHMIQAMEKARQTHRASQDAMQMPTGMSRADNGRIDYTKAQPVTLDKSVLQENRILTGLEPGLFTEPYHLLRTQILHRFSENNWNTLAVTSPCEGEGKTLTAINLAISMAREIAYSVLLVDANLRHPVMLEQFGIPERRGLSDYLTGDMPIEDLLVHPSHFEELVILPAGRPLDNSSEMLNSPKMEQLVRDMKSCGDNRIIIFDLPPVLSTTDAMTFSPQVDAALLVIEDGVTKRQDVECAVEQLSGTQLVGTVMNKAGTRISR